MWLWQPYWKRLHCSLTNPKRHGTAMSDDKTKYHGSCYCGAVEVTVVGPPFGSGYCHCESCRKWHSTPFCTWSGWSSDSVDITGATIISDKNPESQRISCAKCGGGVAIAKPEDELIAVFAMALADSDFKFEPEMHTFYGERVMDFADGLPKFVDGPADWVAAVRWLRTRATPAGASLTDSNSDVASTSTQSLSSNS